VLFTERRISSGCHSAVSAIAAWFGMNDTPMLKWSKTNRSSYRLQLIMCTLAQVHSGVSIGLALRVSLADEKHTS
jgi:hypothetical protein